jgi:hypothetical protein
MTCSARRYPSGSTWRAALVVALAALGFACSKQPSKPYMVEARAPTTGAAALVPPDLALGFLKEIRSQPSQSLLAGEATIPPCQFTEKGAWSAGEYRKVTGQRAPTQITNYDQWVLFKIEDPNGKDLAPADLQKSGAWNYSLRTPRSARTVFGTSDRCVIGPTSEPVKKVVEALTALGVSLPPEYTYIVR